MLTTRYDRFNISKLEPYPAMEQVMYVMDHGSKWGSAMLTQKICIPNQVLYGWKK